MAEPVRARRLTDQEGQRLQQIVRRGKHGSVRVRRLAPRSPGERRMLDRLLARIDDETIVWPSGRPAFPAALMAAPQGGNLRLTWPLRRSLSSSAETGPILVSQQRELVHHADIG
jgi:hypothetical protein